MTIFTALALIAGLTASPVVHSQDNAREDLSPCPGSSPEPTQTAAWSVAFCNRTGHDIVLEFHDNECPAQNWGRRDDVYQRTLRKGESKTMPLCYANEPAGKNPPPGLPMLRIPGGKGVVTTWSVVGDCGERSKALNLDARSFYDRGDYKSGIVLLQYPAGAPHCFADSSAESGAGTGSRESVAAGAGTTGAAVAGAASAAAGAATASAVAPHSPTAALPPGTPSAAGTAVPPAPTAPPRPVVNSPPSLTVAIDTKDAIGRTVRVFANGSGGPGYKCSFTLELQFSDGAGWNDFVKTNVMGTEGDSPVITRKYLKSVTKADLKALKCAPL